MLPKKRKFTPSEYERFTSSPVANNVVSLGEESVTVTVSAVVQDDGHEDEDRIEENASPKVVDLSRPKVRVVDNEEEEEHQRNNPGAAVPVASSPGPGKAFTSSVDRSAFTNVERSSASSTEKQNQSNHCVQIRRVTPEEPELRQLTAKGTFDVDLREWLGHRVLARRDKYFCPGVIRDVYDGYSVSIHFDGEDQPLVYHEVMAKSELDTVISDAVPNTNQVSAI